MCLGNLAPEASESDNPAVLRRIHHPHLIAGRLALEPAQAHHLRDVLRLGVGDDLEVFDDAGSTARAVIEALSEGQVLVRVEQVRPAESKGFELTVASAIPKAQRADWMIEKLSELGTDRFIPLATSRSVVLPEGKNKYERWRRLAAEAAEQSRRRGVMQIGELTELTAVVEQLGADFAVGWHLSTAPDAAPIARLLQDPSPRSIVLFIGPEGGWTEEEIARFSAAGVRGVALTQTVLRVETAAVAAAAIVSSIFGTQTELLKEDT